MTDLELFAYVNHQTGFRQVGQFTPPGLVEFRIPKVLPVETGNAGNHPATLTYTDSNNEPVTCSYRGGAGVPHPTSRVDIAKGLRYEFVGCSNGLAALTETLGRDFELEIDGDDQALLGHVTSVGLSVQVGSCQKRLGSFLAPGEAVQMFEDFSWQSSPEVAQENPDGTPALYYATIYVKDEQDQQRLDALLIHNQPYPLFLSEYPRELFGGCGGVTTGGDFAGEWVFAVIPGAVYNEIRRLIVDEDLEVEGERMLFDAIVLRPVPVAAATNPNGSLNYEYLVQQAGFQWRLRGTPVAELPDMTALDATALRADSAIVAAALRAFETVLEVAIEVVRVVTQVLAYIDAWLAGTVRVGLDIDIDNTTRAFGNADLRRAWGPLGGTELNVHGARVDLFQVVSRVYTLGAPMPTLYSRTLNRAGQASFDVAQNNWTGGTVFGGLCIQLENQAARLSQLLTPFLWCSFPSAEILDAQGAPTGGSSTILTGFSDDSRIRLDVRHPALESLAEFNESREYAREVLGMNPKQARVRVGSAANLGVFGTSATALCANVAGLDVSDLSDLETVASFLTGVGALDPANVDNPVQTAYAAWVGASDILLPDGSAGGRVRGVATHEYGHFVLCNYFADLTDAFGFGSGSRASLFRDLYSQTAIEGLLGDDAVDPDDDARILNEAFADFIAGQVVGGVNYFGSSHSDQVDSMEFCNGRGASCLDQNPPTENERVGSPGVVEVARVSTLLHDVVDGHYRNSQVSVTKQVVTPNNGDFHRATGASVNGVPAVVYSPISYGNRGDEQVALPGHRLERIVRDFLQRANGTGGFEFRLVDFRRAVAAGMRSVGVNWCDACEVMALHEPGLSVQSSVVDRWEACTTADFAGALGEPNDPNLVMDGPSCRACAPNVIRQEGQFCRLPPGRVSGPCADTQDASGAPLPGADVVLPSPAGPVALCALAGGTTVPGPCSHVLDAVGAPVGGIEQPASCDVPSGALLAGPCAATTTGSGAPIAGADVPAQWCEITEAPSLFSGCPANRVCVPGPCSNVTDGLGRPLSGGGNERVCVLEVGQQVVGPCAFTHDGLGVSLPGRDLPTTLCELTAGSAAPGVCEQARDSLGGLVRSRGGTQCAFAPGTVVPGPCASVTNDDAANPPGAIDVAGSGCELPVSLSGTCDSWQDATGAPLPGTTQCPLQAELIAGPCAATRDDQGMPLPGTDVQTACSAPRVPISGACADIRTAAGNPLPGSLPNQSIATGSPRCVACPPGQFADRVANECRPCPPGQVVADNECVPCALQDIVVDNQCVPCPFGTGPDVQRLSCFDCLADATLSLGSACAEQVSATAGPAAPGDNCPGQFWVNFHPTPGTRFLLTADVAEEPVAPACQATTAILSYFDTTGTAVSAQMAGQTCTPITDPNDPDLFIDCPEGTCDVTVLNARNADDVPTPLRVNVAAEGSPTSLTPVFTAGVLCPGDGEQR